MARRLRAYRKAAGDSHPDIGIQQIGPTSTLSSGINWDTWKPGDTEAALKTADGGLKDLLDQVNLTIKGINETTMDRLGNILSEGLAAGNGPNDIARDMRDYIDDPARAEMIATTEANRAQTDATSDQLQEMGFSQFDWLAYDGACEECLDLEDNNPWDMDSDQPPDHPNCRCSIVGSGEATQSEDSGDTGSMSGGGLSDLGNLIGDSAEIELPSDAPEELVIHDTSGSKLDPLSSTPLSEQMPISSAIHKESHFTPEVFDQFYGKTQNGAVDYGSAYRGTENTQLKNLLEAQGFNKPPEKVDGLTFAGMKQQGWTLLARGISGDTQAEVEMHVEQFKNSESPFIGKGMFGDGTYYSSHDAEGLKVAAEFAQSTAKGESKNAGEVMSVALHPDANRITLDDLVTQLQKEKNEAVNARETATSVPLIDAVQWDDNISQFAAMKGYDAVEIPNPQINFSKPDGGMVNTSYWVVLNRGATAVLDE